MIEVPEYLPAARGEIMIRLDKVANTTRQSFVELMADAPLTEVFDMYLERVHIKSFTVDTDERGSFITMDFTTDGLEIS